MTTRTLRVLLTASAAFWISACGGDDGKGTADGGLDAGAIGSGARDAGPDAGARLDASAPADAAVPSDASRDGAQSVEDDAGAEPAPCGNGAIDSAELCDGVNLDGADCTYFGRINGTLACTAGCLYDISGCLTCGNAWINSGEDCDGANLGGADCTTLGLVDGTLGCTTGCAYDTAACLECGNGVVDAAEDCDGVNLGGADCTNLGLVDGALGCTAGCLYDTAACLECGNGVVDAAEDCDGVDLGGADCTDFGLVDGTLGCTTGCAYDTTMCTSTLTGSSSSRTISLSNDGTLVAMVNPEFDSISVFSTANDTLIHEIPVGDEPSSVVIAPDNSTAYVANRADASVMKITDIAGTPAIDATLPVGSEPTGVALSPTGQQLFVAQWAESNVSAIWTDTMILINNIPVRNPRAVAVTNDGDAFDEDELLVVPEFFGVPVSAEAEDDSRNATLRTFTLDNLPNYTEQAGVSFSPRAVATPGGSPFTFASATSPNQLSALALREDAASGHTRAYITSIAASPGGAARFDSNVYPVIWVGDLVSENEVTSADGTVNLTEEVETQVTGGKLFLGDLVSIDFVGATNVAYALSRAANAVQRVLFDSTGPILGTAGVKQIDLGSACAAPTGLVVSRLSPRAYVNCWNSRKLGIIDLATQALTASPSAVTDQSTDPLDGSVNRGRRFFFTGRGRWSSDGSIPTSTTLVGQGWSSCASCHPDGLSDNITWAFPAGPRQSTSLDGSYSHGSGGPQRRIFNWTGIFDEMHDFERNARGVSGGLGTMTTGTCGSAETAVGIDADGLGASVETTVAATCPSKTDFSDIDAWIQTIRPPRGRMNLDTSMVASGEALFEGLGQGNCVACHSGPGWTLSKQFFSPADTATVKATTFTSPVAWPASWTFYDTTTDPRQIQFQPPEASGTVTAITPNQVACVIRHVGTFGVGPNAVSEVKNGVPGVIAQGEGGYNIPSLYGVNLGAPYFHSGQAQTLEEMFDPAGPFVSHLRAGNSLFLGGLSGGEVAFRIAQLSAFLRSIDANTQEQVPPLGYDGCP